MFAAALGIKQPAFHVNNRPGRNSCATVAIGGHQRSLVRLKPPGQCRSGSRQRESTEQRPGGEQRQRAAGCPGATRLCRSNLYAAD